MVTNLICWTLPTVLMLAWGGADLRAQEKPPEATVTSAAPESAVPAAPPEAAPPPLKARPKYLGLRYDEDYSYLDGPEDAYEPGLLDPIKNIHLGDNWRLTFGGSLRFRVEAETDKAFGAEPRGQDTFQLYQYLLHLNLRYKDSVRVFVEGITAHDEDRDLADRPLDENLWDIHQAFVDWKLSSNLDNLMLRVGRQELLYGNERLVSPLAWANVRRRFDGVKLFTRGTNWDADLFWVRPVIVERRGGDDWDSDTDFWGAYLVYKGMKNHGLDLFAFALDNAGELTNPNGKVGDRDVYTLGSRFWGKPGDWDYEAEVAGQWGHWAGDRVAAWSFASEMGYTFRKLPWKPRIGAGYDWATGDQNPGDNTVETFNQLFPLGHKYLGYLDLVGRQNINAVNVNMGFWPAKTVQMRMFWHVFCLQSDKDSLYNAAGAPTRRNTTQNSTDIGNELDITVLWKIGANADMLLGWSHLFEGSFIQDTGPSDDADLLYVQWEVRF